MADIKLIIRIPEEKAERLLAQMQLDRNFRECKITQLPKGHGNLIDYYDAVELINNKADEENSNFTINDIEKFGALLREVNPIIEADKESKVQK